MKNRSKEYVKATFLWVFGIFVFVFFAILVASPFILWIAQPYRQLDVWVVDKTVPYPDFREHSGLFWLLNNEKISKPGTKVLYDVRTDYYGFYPTSKEEWSTIPMPHTAKKPDLIYIADTYGVYRDDYMQKKLPNAFSSLIYGGLIMTIQHYPASHGWRKHSCRVQPAARRPTTGTCAFWPSYRLKWQADRNYYEILAKMEVSPIWVVENWESEKKQTWKMGDAALLLLTRGGGSKSSQKKDDIGKNGMKMIFRQEWAKTLGIKKPTSYRYWFEWVIADPLVEEIAHYDLDVTPSGKKKLDALGLPNTFPAIVRFKNDQFTSWYFAGDFADLQFSGTTYRMKGIQTIKRILADDTVDNNSYFFWKVYAPLMHHILADIEQRRVETRATTKPAETQVRVRAVKEGIQLKSSTGEWRTVFLRSVNMGPAEPGNFLQSSLMIMTRMYDGSII